MPHVLIIEDDPLIALHLAALLEDNGATSAAIADTQAAAVKEAIQRPPAFITSDIRLACGSGILAVLAIRERQRAVPVVFVTSTPDVCPPCDRVTKVFRKPINETAIAKVFRQLLGYRGDVRGAGAG